MIESNNNNNKKKKKKKNNNNNMIIINLLEQLVQNIEEVCYYNTSTNRRRIFNSVLDQFYDHLNEIYDNYDITTSNDYQIRIYEKKVEDLISHFNSSLPCSN